MKAGDLVRQYLSQINIMQLATAVNDQPWVCTVHYYNDENLNFYWISDVNRQHSLEISQNPKVTSYVLVHENTPSEKYVIGISIIGTAEVIENGVDSKVSSGYLEKLAKNPKMVSQAQEGKSTDRFYRLKPTKIVLFDSKNFPDIPRQEWDLT